MKNKKILLLLVPLTLFLWSMIAYKLLNHLNHNEPSSVKYQTTIDNISGKQITDTFSLVANYKDPFLKGIQSSTDIAPMNIRLNDVPKQPAIIEWPRIKYGGMILNKSTKSYLYFVEIDNVNHLLKKGDQVAQIKLSKVSEGSISVLYKNQEKTILKEKL